MNLFNDSILYSEKYGYTFEDLNSYIEDSEKLKCTYDNKLNDSEALKYVLCDNVPDSVLKRKRIMDVENSYTQKYIRFHCWNRQPDNFWQTIFRVFADPTANQGCTIQYLSSFTHQV